MLQELNQIIAIEWFDPAKHCIYVSKVAATAWKLRPDFLTTQFLDSGFSLSFKSNNNMENIWQMYIIHNVLQLLSQNKPFIAAFLVKFCLSVSLI